ncbi:ribosomal-processing cysteine protease Prp [Paenibacillus sp. IB182496]|uniref:Ribosomal processing cysteine protease Prp n=1 Tax=Paenibacillus sabuli TaxID=2772509 RepID=A0A927GRD4_9BACL|nr:ribosomal-processing cysteine protease Prp [Paenibacillus sabuli]MBD2844607.1 ribosomal-processing cysteine protease Prp [Paenibacillus sabuli]
MIRVTIRRSGESGRVDSFAIEGHARFAPVGEDIVCAGVSAVSVGTVNAIESLAGLELPAAMKGGWLSSDIPATGDAVVDERVQLLLESMIVMLETIAGSYAEHVVIRQHTG